jgi:hypothetical protein
MGIGEWFKERWVDISRPKKGGGFEPCGRDEAGRRGFPKCVPAAKAATMTAAEIKSAVTRKRKEVGWAKSIRSPVRVATFSKLAKARKARGS